MRVDELSDGAPAGMLRGALRHASVCACSDYRRGAVAGAYAPSQPPFCRWFNWLSSYAARVDAIRPAGRSA